MFFTNCKQCPWPQLNGAKDFIFAANHIALFYLHRAKAVLNALLLASALIPNIAVAELEWPRRKSSVSTTACHAPQGVLARLGFLSLKNSYLSHAPLRMALIRSTLLVYSS